MDTISSSNLKQHLGEVLAGLSAPVQIQRHGRLVGVLVPPAGTGADRGGARRLARARQERIEAERHLRHARVAVELLTGEPESSASRVAAARAIVERWALEGTCSRDYIERWRDLLARPIPELARALVSDLEGWGAALRQNSPWAEDQSGQPGGTAA